MIIPAEQLAGWKVDTGGIGDAALAKHAAAELRLHVAMVPRDTTGASGAIFVAAGTSRSDGFSAEVAEDRIELRGDSPRGALNAIYWLLEQAGFSWVEPGDEGICLRRGSGLAPGTYREEPAFVRRTLILGQDAFTDDWAAWMEWASRNRLNDLFFHDTPPSRWERPDSVRPSDPDALAGAGGWLFERWDADGPAIVAAASERAMGLQFGGHHLPAMLPRAQFEKHPERFTMRGGVRDARYNLCTSDAGARAELAANAARFFERFGGASVYHLWADDIRGGGWCDCPACAHLSPSDQALRATNVVAEVLAARYPDAKLAYLAYHDTVEPPAQVRPIANVVALWAPRERCYAHDIADPECTRNVREYWQPYQGVLALFDNDRERVCVFEYYSDAILFKGLAPTHLRVLAGDVRAYAPGAHNLQNLMVSNRPWVGLPWNAWWMARSAWDAGAEREAALTQFCEGAFPGASVQIRALYAEQERAYRLFLDLHDLEPPTSGDVLDFSDRPRRTLGAKAPELLEAALILRRVVSAMQALAGGEVAENGRLGREKVQAAAVAAIAEHIAQRVAAWDAIQDGLRPLAAEHLSKAQSALAQFEAWDAEHTPVAFANISRGMLRGMHRQTRRVEGLVSGG